MMMIFGGYYFSGVCFVMMSERLAALRALLTHRLGRNAVAINLMLMFCLHKMVRNVGCQQGWKAMMSNRVQVDTYTYPVLHERVSIQLLLIYVLELFLSSRCEIDCVQ
jgi:hypothetical protein